MAPDPSFYLEFTCSAGRSRHHNTNNKTNKPIRCLFGFKILGRLGLSSLLLTFSWPDAGVETPTHRECKTEASREAVLRTLTQCLCPASRRIRHIPTDSLSGGPIHPMLFSTPLFVTWSGEISEQPRWSTPSPISNLDRCSGWSTLSEN